jgi:hypothetical protein
MSRRYRAAAAAVGLLLPLGLATTPADAAVRGPFTYAARNSHKCLDVNESSRASYAPILQWTCKAVDKRANQNWFHDYTGRVNFRNQNSNLCIDGYRGKNGQVVQLRCDGSPEQRWIVHRVRGGIAFENVKFRGLCMDVERSSTANRARVILWTCNYHNNQVFD